MTWEPKESPGHLIIRSGRFLMRLADSHLKPLGVAAGQVPIIRALHDGAELSQIALARLVRIEQPTMAATLTRMERDGLVERRPDAADGRSTLFRLTPAAVAKTPGIQAALARGREEMLAGFDAAERRLLTDLLHRVLGNVEAAVQRDDAAAASQARSKP